MHRQQLLRVSHDTLNQMLDRGARVVWIKPVESKITGGTDYDVVLETVREPEFSPTGAVLEFLANVNPQELEQQLLERGMDESMGNAILTILAKAAVDGSA